MSRSEVIEYSSRAPVSSSNVGLCLCYVSTDAISYMQMDIWHMHAGVDHIPLNCGLDCPQSIGSESSRQVLAQSICSIAAGRVVRVEFHSIQVVQMGMEGCSIVVEHAIADVHDKHCFLLYM
jgi:hypothetical protein